MVYPITYTCIITAFTYCLQQLSRLRQKNWEANLVKARFPKEDKNLEKFLVKPSTNNVFRGCEDLLATCIKKIDIRRDETPRKKGKFSVLVNKIKDELPSNGLNILMKFSMKKSDDYKNEWEVKNQNIKNLENFFLRCNINLKS